MAPNPDFVPVMQQDYEQAVTMTIAQVAAGCDRIAHRWIDLSTYGLIPAFG